MSATKKTELAAAEDRGWTELSSLIEGLSPGQMQEMGYYPEWSVKDLLGHVAAWLAEAGVRLERIRMGTYRPDPYDVEAMNVSFFEANKDLPLTVVRAECWSSRNRMLEEWDLLSEVTPPAEEWFVGSGAEHYEEHVPRMGEWAKELGAA